MSKGKDDPFVCSKSNAGPWDLLILSAISVISRNGSTSEDILISSPLFSSAVMNSSWFLKDMEHLEKDIKLLLKFVYNKVYIKAKEKSLICREVF